VKPTKFQIWITIGLFSVLLPACSPKVLHLAKYSTENINVSDVYTKEDSTALALISPYKKKVDEQMNEVIGYTDHELTKALPSSSLTNWFSDAIFEAAVHLNRGELDFVVQNYGGIRLNSVAKGNITIGKIYELMPFDNQFVVLTLSGKDVAKLFDYVSAKGGWPVSKEVKCTIVGGKVQEVLIKGKPLDSSGSYRVGISDYLANGGDELGFLSILPREESGILIRDLILDHVKRNPEVKVDLVQRILFK